MKNVFRTLLVVTRGDEDPMEVAHKYSLDREVDEHVKYRYDDKEKLYETRLKLLDTLLRTKTIKLTEAQKDLYKTLYLEMKEMTPFDYYMELCSGCKYDEETGDALTKENPEAHYRAERCYEQRLRRDGEEGPFSNPFHLKDGTLSYSAKLNEIDWDREHLYNQQLYKRAWELVMNDSEPQNEQEEHIKKNMSNRIQYFMNFGDVDEYVRHSTSFWTYAYAEKDKYSEVSFEISDKVWVAEFYEKFIEPLRKAKDTDNIKLTIFEIRSLND